MSVTTDAQAAVRGRAGAGQGLSGTEKIASEQQGEAARGEIASEPGDAVERGGAKLLLRGTREWDRGAWQWD